MSRGHVIVRGEEGLGDVLQAYLEAIEAGTRELVVDLPAGSLGLERAGAPASLSLSSVTATVPPDIEVTLRSRDGLCVLVDLPVRIAARRLSVEGVAVVGGPPTAVALSATEALVLDDVIVLDSPADERTGSTVQVQAAGAGTEATIRALVLGGARARDALLGLYTAAGAWFGRLHVEGLVAAGREADAVVAMDSVAELRMRDCRLAAGDARVLMRMLVAPTDAELTGCRLSAGPGALVHVVHPYADRVVPVRLGSGSAVTVPPAGLPEEVAAATGVDVVAGATVDGEIADAVGRAARRVLGVDERLERRLAGLA